MKKLTMILCCILFLLCGMSVFASETDSESAVMIDEELKHIDAEDPQYGRENGCLAEGFIDAQPYVARDLAYSHDDKFDNHIIREVIDVSRYQYGINWLKVKKSGIDYAIIRAGFRGYGESGSLNVDTYFKENMREALGAGVEVGVYFFSQAITEKEAVEEANYVLNLIKGYDVSLPVVIDYEYASDGNGLTGRLYKAGLSKNRMTKICKAFCETVESQGYTAMVYADKNMLEKKLNAAEIAKDYKIWLANYTTNTTYEGEYEFWQYTQDASVEGIYGTVDKSFWYVAPKTGTVIKNIAVNIKDTLADRISGKTRYETSFKIAETFKKELGVKQFDNVIVASGKNFADALAGSYLANVKKAPIIMTNGKNAQDVKDYIKNNLKSGGTVYILGGTAAVPEGVGCGLKEYKVKRLSGSTRYETNLEILKEARVTKQDILVCTGKNFADSLSGSAAKRPILLVSGSLSEKQKAYLSSLSGNKYYILGGEAAVSKGIETAIKKYGTVRRIGGATRFETSVMIAETFFKTPESLVLAYSNNFPDGLCGGPLAMSKNAPLILTRTGKIQAAKDYAEAKKIHKGAVLGGDILIDDNSVGKILGKLSNLKNQATAEFTEIESGEFAVQYDVTMAQVSSSDNNYYLMLADSYDGSMVGKPIASFKKEVEFSNCTDILDREKIRELVMSDVVLAVKKNDGSYEAVNKPVRISNTAIVSNNTAERFVASSKKGIQGINKAGDGAAITDARYANTKQTLLNLDLSSVVGKSAADGYVEYQYKGKNYFFSDCRALRSTIRDLNSGYEQYLYGNDDTTPVSVTLCLLLGYNKDTAYLIDPAARTAGKNYYTLNVHEKKARETLEALFLYLGEIFGEEDCFVTNWVLGNEINSSKAWNYSGSLNFDEYMKRYAAAYEMLYNGIKFSKTGNTVAISLDNGWTASPNTYSGKNTLDAFAKKIHALNPQIQWSIAYHAYSYPLTRVDFWNDRTNTSDSVTTKYISMRNIKVLTDYAKSLEEQYKLPKNSIRVLLTEQGYSYSSGNPKQQVEALARAYYTAEFNERIDAFIVRAILDAKEETKDGLYLGLMNEKTEKRVSFYVYEYMDSNLTKFAGLAAETTVSPANYSNFNGAKEILCKTNWKSIVPGFDMSKF